MVCTQLYMDTRYKAKGKQSDYNPQNLEDYLAERTLRGLVFSFVYDYETCQLLAAPIYFREDRALKNLQMELTFTVAKRKANQVNPLTKAQEGTMEQSGHQEGGGSSSVPLSQRPWNDSEIRIFLLEWEMVEQEVDHSGQKLEKKVRAIRKRLYQQHGLRKSWQESWQLMCDLLSLHSRLCNDRGRGSEPLFSPYSEDLYRILGHRQEWSSQFSGPVYDGAGNPLLPMSSGPVYYGAEKHPHHMSSGPVYDGAGNPQLPMSSGPVYDRAENPPHHMYPGPVYDGAGNPHFHMSSGPAYDGAGNPQFPMYSGPVYDGAGNPHFPMSSDPVYSGAGNPKIPMYSGPVHFGAWHNPHPMNSGHVYDGAGYPVGPMNSEPVYFGAGNSQFPKYSGPVIFGPGNPPRPMYSGHVYDGAGRPPHPVYPQTPTVLPTPVHQPSSAVESPVPRKANQVNRLTKGQEGTMEQRGHQEGGGSSSGNQSEICAKPNAFYCISCSIVTKAME
ncbi:hypothetical protein STEG23_021986 [Scotinomys teguina]